jgi:hypothetical protein
MTDTHVVSFGKYKGRACLQNSLKRCDGCRRSWNEVYAGPMLCDATWRRLADEAETLCEDCVRQRSFDRRVRIALADLLPCEFNLFHWPHSYFNLFASIETPPTVVSNKWRVAAAGYWPMCGDTLSAALEREPEVQP